MIMSGVTIGTGSVVAARSVVVKDIPPYAVVGGNPAKVLKYRFKEEEIAKLLSLKWWNWSESQVKEAMYVICDTNIDNLWQYWQEKISNKTN